MRSKRPRFTPPHFVIISLFILFLAGCGAKSTDTTSDTTAPINTTASNFISSGALSTSSTTVTLAISATDSVGVTGYYAAETSTTPSAASSWTSVTTTTSYSANVSFTLSSGDAAKTVYVWFKDSAGNVSASVNDSITLSTSGSGVGAKFPIATTTAYEMGFSSAFDGTNWLVGIGTDVDGSPGGGQSADAQFISQSGTKVNSLIQGGGNGGSGTVAYGGGSYLLLGSDGGGLNPAVAGDLWGKSVSTSGTLGSKFLIRSGSDFTNSNFEGTAYGGGSFLVVYEGEDTLGIMKVYGKIVSPSGTVGSEIAISSGYGGFGKNNVAFDGTNFLVVWTDDSNDYEVKGRFVSPAGTLGTEFTINASTYPSDNSLTVAFDGTNYLVVWTDEVSTGEWDVFGQLIDKSGSKVGNVISISSAAGQQSFLLIAFDGTNYLVTWTDTRNDADKDLVCDVNEGTCLDIYGQYISVSGTLVGSEFVINNDAGGQFGGVVGFNNGKYLVIINDGFTNGHSDDVYVVFVTP